MSKYVKIYYDNGKNDNVPSIEVALPEGCLGIKMITTFERKLTADEKVIWP